MLLGYRLDLKSHDQTAREMGVWHRRPNDKRHRIHWHHGIANFSYQLPTHKIDLVPDEKKLKQQGTWRAQTSAKTNPVRIRSPYVDCEVRIPDPDNFRIVIGDLLV